MRQPVWSSAVGYLTEALAYVALLFTLHVFGASHLVLSAALVFVLVWVSVTDLRRREIPDGANLVVAVIGVVLWWGDAHDLIQNLLVAVSVTLLLAVGSREAWRRTGHEWLGLGDVKLIGGGALVVGWNALWFMMFLASVGGICATLLGRRRAIEEGVPFGPFLAYSVLVTHLIAGPPS